jgi:hypothetical protein
MIIGITEDLPRGTIINLFHPISQYPIAVLPAPDDPNLANGLQLSIYPPSTRVQQQQQPDVDPNPNPERPTQ